MKEYRVEMADTANRDLRDIVLYIRDHYREPRTAKELYWEIKARISELNQMPERYPLYQDEQWYSWGLRKMLVKNFLVFYSVDHEQNVVNVIRIMYAGRDITVQLSLTETE